jgi:hypothetical protein
LGRCVGLDAALTLQSQVMPGAFRQGKCGDGSIIEYRRRGRSGLKLSEICVGTMTFGDGTDMAEAEPIVHASLDASVTFFGWIFTLTAAAYNLVRIPKLPAAAA